MLWWLVYIRLTKPPIKSDTLVTGMGLGRDIVPDETWKLIKWILLSMNQDGVFVRDSGIRSWARTNDGQNQNRLDGGPTVHDAS